MKDSLFRKILFAILIVGVISVITLSIITMVMYKNVSMITFIEKEIW